jgi:hypothetical protein
MDYKLIHDDSGNGKEVELGKAIHWTFASFSGFDTCVPEMIETSYGNSGLVNGLAGYPHRVVDPIEVENGSRWILQNFRGIRVGGKYILEIRGAIMYA